MHSPAARQRRAIVRLCVAALLLLGFVAQQHALAHALSALQAPQHDALAGHAQACEQCLQLADAGAALPPLALAEWLPPVPEALAGSVPVLPRRSEAFTAYASRAPPLRG